jgi:hypothetical protein
MREITLVKKIRRKLKIIQNINNSKLISRNLLFLVMAKMF